MLDGMVGLTRWGRRDCVAQIGSCGVLKHRPLKNSHKSDRVYAATGDRVMPPLRGLLLLRSKQGSALPPCHLGLFRAWFARSRRINFAS